MRFGAVLADLVLPVACAGCAVPGVALCPDCGCLLRRPEPAVAVPTPAPPGLPTVIASGRYEGVLRGALLAYKERGRYGLAALLGTRLAAAASVAVRGEPVLLIPVPATAAAARARYGDHMTRLARQTASALRRGGIPAAVAYPLAARPRADSTGLDAGERLVAAAQAFAVRPARLPKIRAAAASGVHLLLVDDVMTTGATLAAAADRLGRGGLDVTTAAVLGATRRRNG